MERIKRFIRYHLNKFILVLSFLFVCCQDGIQYYSYQPVSPAGWNRKDTLLYPITPSLPIGNHNIQIGIRHLESYAYRDIWLGLQCSLNDSLVCDTIHLYLADELGNWHGKGIGGLIQFAQNTSLKLSIQDSISPSELRIFHLMSDSVLKYVCDVGLRLSFAPSSINTEEDK